LRERANKREAKLKREKEEKEAKEKELQRVREEAFRVIRAIYIEPFASRLPLVFQENNESYGEERDVECEIFEALKCATTMGERFEETLQDFQKQFSPLAPTFVIITDFEEDEQVERRAIEKKEKFE